MAWAARTHLRVPPLEAARQHGVAAAQRAQQLHALHTGAEGVPQLEDHDA